MKMDLVTILRANKKCLLILVIWDSDFGAFYQRWSLVRVILWRDLQQEIWQIWAQNYRWEIIKQNPLKPISNSFTRNNLFLELSHICDKTNAKILIKTRSKLLLSFPMNFSTNLTQTISFSIAHNVSLCCTHSFTLYCV